MNSGIKLPQLHLWVYNHSLDSISDQVDFFTRVLKHYGYGVTISRRPRIDALNVVIENFSESSSNTLIEFCRQTGKRVAIIMTEHLDLYEDQLLIHGDPLWNDNDYMHSSIQVARIKNLMDCLPWLRALFVLGDLPRLEGSDHMFSGLPVRTLPFPFLERADISKQSPKYDFVFTGYLTSFRKQFLQRVAASYSLSQSSQLLPRQRRDQLNSQGNIVLNIPQRPGWNWLSLMRVIAALQRGRATVSIGTEDTSWIARCCIQLSETEWASRLGEVSADWQGAYSTAYGNYELMRKEFLAERGFPSDLFGYWAILEKKNLL